MKIKYTTYVSNSEEKKIMNREDFLKQMIAFGQELLEQEQRPKINIKAKDKLQILYNSLSEAVNAAADLELLFQDKKRKIKASKAVSSRTNESFS